MILNPLCIAARTACKPPARAVAFAAPAAMTAVLAAAVALTVGLAEPAALTAASAAAGPRTSTPFDIPWETCAPEEVGISSDALANMLERIDNEDLEIHSIVIIKDERLVLEAYVHPYDRDTIHNVKSVSKSVISALVGIALREGVIGGLDEKVCDYLPQYITEDMDARKREISLYNLLTMTSGLDLDENGPISGRIFGTLDWLKATYEQPMALDPGTRFLYSTPLTHTMSAILTESGGMGLHEFADAHLFGPLGFGEVQWRTGPKGYNFGGAELFLRPIDMAKFGYLFLKGGVWEGQEIVPAEWVAESTTNKLAGIEDRHRYGYWWWLDDESWYRASGWGGQAIAINESLNVVLAVTAGDFGAPREMFREYVERYMDSSRELEASPEGVERLERLLHRLQHPSPEAVPDMPERAGEISGKKFVMEWNDLGIESLVLVFGGDDEAGLSVDMTVGEFDAAIGLDGVYRVSDIGRMGDMPSGNKRASKGYWVNDNTFHVSSRELGNPVCFEYDLTFDRGEIEATVAFEPLGRSSTLRGKAE